jgi:hypothetical protein
LFLVAREGIVVRAEALRATVGEVVDHGEDREREREREREMKGEVKKRVERMAVWRVNGGRHGCGTNDTSDTGQRGRGRVGESI